MAHHREQTNTDSSCDLKNGLDYKITAWHETLVRPRSAPLPPSRGAARAPAPHFSRLCHSGLHLCINADWDVSASRDGVHENGHNEQLAEEAAQAFAALCRQFGLQMPSPVDYLGDRPPLSRCGLSITRDCTCSFTWSKAFGARSAKGAKAQHTSWPHTGSSPR